VFYMQGGGREVVLYAITIDPHQPISMNLSDLGAQAAEQAVQQILAEVKSFS
jgi:hydrogenase maturation protease